MSKEVKFIPFESDIWPHKRVRIWMTTRSSYGGRIVSERQFTVARADLLSALKDADLLPPQTVINPNVIEGKVDNVSLANEIALYDNLDRGSRTAYGEMLHSQLWNRIVTKMGLPRG